MSRNDHQTSSAVADLAYPDVAATSLVRAQRSFSLSMLVSGIRCTLAYVVLPFATPFLGIAPGVGPVLGITIGVVAVAANVISLRRFWRIRHRWRRPITVLHVGVIALLLVLMALDVADLAGRAA